MQESMGAFNVSLFSYLGEEIGTPDIEVIKQVAAHAFHVTVRDLEKKQRTQRLALVRYIAMYLTRELTGLSFPEIGRAFNRDHSTVMHGCGIIKRRSGRDSMFAAMIAGLKEECAGKTDKVMAESGEEQRK